MCGAESNGGPFFFEKNVSINNLFASTYPKGQHVRDACEDYFQRNFSFFLGLQLSAVIRRRVCAF
jgi:hypothetical protein